jgi:hypothetical protein
MLLYAPVSLRALRWLLRLVRLHDCDAEQVAPGFWLVEGTRVGPLLADALQDTRISVVKATAEA